MAADDRLIRSVGRLIIGKVPGTQLDEQCRQLLSSGIMGGVTLFKDNASNLKQLSDLIFDIVSTYAESSEDIPLISVDQEGGAVQRFDHVITPLPSAMALAATNNQQMLNQATNISAQELKLLGINCLFSPVLDLALNPANPIIATRAFSDNLALVQSLGKVVTESLNQQGILAVGKHFPGHGSTTDDSHLLLPVNRQEPDELWQSELAPFRHLLPILKSILISHVWFSNIDEEPLPASLSHKITSGVLREHLKFDRLIMTDDMLMKAITSKWGLEEASLMALEAGADVLLVCGTAEEIASVNDAIVQAIKAGRISEERVDQSIQRLERALIGLSKERYLQIRAGKKDQSMKKLEESIARNHKVCLGISQSSICQLRGEKLDIKGGKWLVAIPDHPRYKMPLFNYLKGVNATECRYSLNPDEDEIEKIVEQATDKNCLFLTYRTVLNPQQVELGRALQSACGETMAVALDAPYDAGLIDWDNYLATFDPSDLALEALAKALLDKQDLTGQCPINTNILSPVS